MTGFGPYVSFGVLPLFALANAGVRLDTDTVLAAARSPLTWGGVVTGLVLGKLIGITGATWIVQRTGLGRLSPGLTLRRIAGGAALSGIGFTISLFIVDLAITDPPRSADLARVGVLAASVIAFTLGWAVFRLTDKLSPPVPVGLKLVRDVDPERDHIRGRADAPLTLVEYGDFECPFCSRATGSIDEVREYFGDELRYVWRHLPLERVHPRAVDAARASEAAALQGKFFDLAVRMFEFQDYLEWQHIYRYADQVGCDIAQFDEDLHSSRVLHRVDDDAQDAELMDLNATPTFFVNGVRHKSVGCRQPDPCSGGWPTPPELGCAPPGDHHDRGTGNPAHVHVDQVGPVGKPATVVEVDRAAGDPRAEDREVYPVEETRRLVEGDEPLRVFEGGAAIRLGHQKGGRRV